MSGIVNRSQITKVIVYGSVKGCFRNQIKYSSRIMAKNKSFVFVQFSSSNLNKVITSILQFKAQRSPKMLILGLLYLAKWYRYLTQLKANYSCPASEI